MKKVSVVILTKNCEDTIRDCLESIRRNNYKNTEIIIIDGHSSDKTIEIAKKYTNKIFFDEGKGFFGKARNLGISKAEGDIILFISGDAYIEKNYIKNLLKNMKTCDACCGKEIYKPITKDRFSRIFKEIAIPSKFSTVNFAIKKEIAKKIKFNEKVKASEDQLYFIELKKRGYKLKNFENLVCYHQTKANLTHLIKKRKKEGFYDALIFKRYPKEFLKKFIISFLFLPPLPSILRVLTSTNLSILDKLYGIFGFLAIHYSLIYGFWKGLIKKYKLK